MGASDEQTALALVAYSPLSKGQWNLEAVIPRPIKENEVLVRIVASGICLADVHFGDSVIEGNDLASSFPRILGHEGSGYVEQVGAAVKSVVPGDEVLLSFHSCGECYSCTENHPAYCLRTIDCNWRGENAMYANRERENFDIIGGFFGQSSFTNKAIVKERSIVNLAGLNITADELKFLAPLGCGVQTGSGAFINIADVQPNQEVAVLGVGGVGQSAIMAAAMRKCTTIIAIDRSVSRLGLARKLGATHTINTADLNVVEEVLKITNGNGVHVALDTTGVSTLAQQAWHFVRRRGKILQVGLAKPDDAWNVPMADHMNMGKQIIGCVEGDAVPQEYVPRMISWYRAGNLPLGMIVKQYPVADWQKALEDMKSGETIKPVLIWE